MSFMRVAFFGGSFDPPHRGHLAIARAAIQLLELDLVWMAPAGAQPLKLDGFATTYFDRLAMVERAVAAETRVVASSADAPRDDGSPNYSIDVLTELRAKIDPIDELYFLLGADAFLSFKSWQRAEELPFLAEFIVAGRPGFAVDDLPASLPPGIAASRLPGAEARGAIKWELRGASGRHSRLYLMPELHEDVSATDIRSALAGETPAEGVLAPAVLRYIQERGLYR